MKKRLAFVLAVLQVLVLFAGVLPMQAQAAEIIDSGNCGDNLTWSLDNEGTLTISGTGAMWGWNSASSVYYPADNDTWTDEVRQSYGGTITWVAVGADTEREVVDSGTCGENLTWALYDDGELVISGTGPMADYSDGEAPWFEHGEYIKTANIDDGVTTIGDYAFAYCWMLENVTNANQVTSIGDYAFSYCNSLTDITIPTNVTTIGDHAFYYCSSLTDITIPANVTTIGYSAFTECYNLRDVTLNRGLKVIGAHAFQWSGVTSITIPNTVTDFDYAFYVCESLRTVTIEEGITSLGDHSFDGCTALNSITIPDSVTDLGDWTFCGAGLNQVTLPKNLTTIGEGTFYSCRKMKHLVIPEGITTIGTEAFSFCENLESVTIPESVISIGRSAFADCYSMKDVYITNPNAWCKIQFEGPGASNPTCYASNLHILDEAGNEISRLTLDSTVTEIPDYAFKGCKLTEICIPASVTRIGYSAFNSSPNLKKIKFEGDAPTFDGINWDGVGVDRAVTIACYPANNDTWTEELLDFLESNSSTNICWVPVDADGVVDSGTCGDNITWSLNDDGELIISGTGAMYDYADVKPWVYTSAINTVIIEEGVTSIGNNVFSDCCPNLQNAIISDTVTSIGNRAFAYNPKLKNIQIGSSVVNIGEYAFSECDNLKTVTIPDSVISIGAGAFGHCNGISIRFDGSAPNIADTAFNQVFARVYYPEGDATWTEEVRQGWYGGVITWIPWTADDAGVGYAEEDGGLMIVNYKGEGGKTVIPAEIDDTPVTAIADHAFSGLKGLTDVVIPASVREISEYAFYNCPNLESVTINGTETSAGIQTFSNAKVSGTIIGNYAFAECTELNTIYFRGNAPTFAEFAFADVTAIAHYPADNTTWTADVRQNYGGTITWKGYTLPNPGVTLTLNETIDINFYTPTGMDHTGFTAKVLLDGKELDVDSYTMTVAKDGRLRVRYCFNSNKMFQELTVQFFDANGNPATKARTMGVRSYVEAVLAKSTDATVRATLIQMLDYGALSQTLKGNDLDNLANSIITAELRAEVENYNWPASTETATETSGTKSGSGFSVSLTLNETIDINFYTEAENLANGRTVKVLRNGKATDDYTLDLMEDGRYRVRYSVQSNLMCDVISVQIVDADGEAVKEARSMSARAYAQIILESNAYDALNKAAMVAMLNYGTLAQINSNSKADYANRYVTEEMQQILENYWK